MKLGAILGATALVLGMATAPARAAVNLVTNGSFELSADPGVYTTLGVGSAALTGWTIASGTIDYVGTYWQASDGARSLDLAGGWAGAIEQTISGLTPGRAYRLSFDLAGNPDGSPVVKQLVASIDIEANVYSFDTTGQTRAAMGWQTNAFEFIATGATAQLRFAALGDPTSPYGPALDNVSLAAIVPEPATWAMLLIGFAGLGLVTHRRARRA